MSMQRQSNICVISMSCKAASSLRCLRTTYNLLWPYQSTILFQPGRVSSSQCLARQSIVTAKRNRRRLSRWTVPSTKVITQRHRLHSRPFSYSSERTQDRMAPRKIIIDTDPVSRTSIHVTSIDRLMVHRASTIS